MQAFISFDSFNWKDGDKASEESDTGSELERKEEAIWEEVGEELVKYRTFKDGEGDAEFFELYWTSDEEEPCSQVSRKSQPISEAPSDRVDSQELRAYFEALDSCFF